jgi:hypothetical protein
MMLTQINDADSGHEGGLKGQGGGLEGQGVGRSENEVGRSGNEDQLGCLSSMAW